MNTQKSSSPPPPNEQLARSTLAVTSIVVVSRVLGFARDLVIAYTLGGSAAADVFVAAFRIPNTARRMISEGMVSMPFIPEYCRRKTKGYLEKGPAEGERRAMLFCRSAMLWILLVLTPLCLLGMIFPEQVMLMVAPGFILHPQQTEAASTLLYLLLPYTLILCTLAVGGAIMQARNRYLSPVIGPCIPNVTVLLVMGAAIWIGDVHLSPMEGGEPTRSALIFCQALLFSGLLQWMYMARNMRQEKLRWLGPVRLKTALPFVMRLPLSFCGTATHQLNILIAGMGASFLAEGTISQLHYADQLISLPLGMFGMAVGVIALPQFTEMANKNEFANLRAGLAGSMKLALYLSMPAAAGLAGIADPLVRILFMRGEFDAQAAHGTTLALQGACLALPAFAISRPLLAACHVKGYVKLTAGIGLVSMLATASMSFALPKAFAALNAPILGIGLSVSLGAWVSALLLWFFMRRKSLTPQPADLSGMGLPFVLSILIFTATWLACTNTETTPWIKVGILAPACAAIYFSVTAIKGCPEARAILNAFKK